MNVKEFILRKIDQDGEVTSRDIQDEADITRQSAHKYLKELRQQGLIRKIGKTKGVKYVRDEPGMNTEHSIQRTYQSDRLEEDKIFRELSLELHLQKQLTPQASDITAYAFTELMNNAIEHSGSKNIRVVFELKPYDLVFHIKDYGVGIFAHIRDSLGLDSEREALQDLLKGKTTTDELRHSGEGIFFSSKAADIMRISSHNLALHFNNRQDELYTQTRSRQQGTTVEFTVSRNSKKDLSDIFERYSGEEYDYSFSKTEVTVSLFTEEEHQFISRSEARRLLHRLDKFEKIVLDFDGIKIIGQGFADQIFRVFQREHPAIDIEPINANDAVAAMISHVKSK